jgi:hypothetical protein
MFSKLQTRQEPTQGSWQNTLAYCKKYKLVLIFHVMVVNYNDDGALVIARQFPIYLQGLESCEDIHSGRLFPCPQILV